MKSFVKYTLFLKLWCGGHYTYSYSWNGVILKHCNKMVSFCYSNTVFHLRDVTEVKKQETSSCLHPHKHKKNVVHNHTVVCVKFNTFRSLSKHQHAVKYHRETKR